jgi:hypothetical protein
MASKLKTKTIVKVEEKDESDGVLVPVDELSVPRGIGYFEMKYFQDYAWKSTSTPTGSSFDLSYIGAGTDYNQRIGRQVRFTRVEVTFDVFANPTSGSEDYLRVILLCDNAPKGNLPLGSSLLDLAPYYQSGQNFKDFGHRFKFLHDWRSPLINPAYSPFKGHGFKVSIPIPKARQLANWSTTAVSTPETNSVILFIANQNVTNPCLFSWYARTYFDDA